MPKVFIKGEKVAIPVSREDAERILSEKNDEKHKGMIDVAGRQIQKGYIREIVFGDEAGRRAYNLDDPADRAKVEAFEDELSALESEAINETPDFKEWGHVLMPQDKMPGWVLNEILGATHWTTVRHAVREGLIRRHPSGTWAILDHSTDRRHTDIKPFIEFERKLQAARELRSRRKTESLGTHD